MHHLLPRHTPPRILATIERGEKARERALELCNRARQTVAISHSLKELWLIVTAAQESKRKGDIIGTRVPVLVQKQFLPDRRLAKEGDHKP